MSEDRDGSRLYTRRAMLEVAGASLAGAFMSGALACGARRDSVAPVRLSARPRTPTRSAPPTGTSRLSLGAARDGSLYVPSTYAGAPSPLLVLLHGAGGSSANWESFPERAEQRGLVLLMPDSRAVTWDLVRGGLGPDVEFIDRALDATFEGCNVDPARVAVAGFSDGASYALNIGLAHGDLFSRIIAYSPGFLVFPDDLVGRPRVFDSHGTEDRVLPISSSRDRIVPTLRRRGYRVTFRPFQGGHTIPGDVADESLDWLVPGR